MAIYKCCVGGCDSTSNNYRLFCMPMNDQLRNLWMSFIAPTNPSLLVLPINQLMKKRVCEKHFDKTQFDQAGVRIRYSYPCLLSEKEIHYGIPLSTKEHMVINEHNYCSLNEPDVNTPETLVLMGVQEYTLDNEHNYCSLGGTVHPLETPVIKGKEDNTFPELQSSYTTEEAACSSKSGEKEKSMKKNSIKNFVSKTRHYIKKCTSMSSDSLGLSSNERIESAQNCANDLSLMENFEKLSKKAKVFLLLQLRLARKNKMARRFSLEDKLLALKIMKQSPKGYKLLENMFALPNKRTLSRLSQKIVFECGINPNIFQHLKMTTRGWDMKKKLCSIVFDEVALTPNLTFNENKDEINGFVDIAGQRRAKFADHALVFMIRGICTPWRQTIAYYFCAGTVSSAELQAILKEIVPSLIETGLKPVAIICDQGSTFRSCIKMLKEDTNKLHNTEEKNYDGTIHIAGVDLFCFFDPPHLLKGVRNNFLEKDIRWNNEKTASWKDIQYIFDLDSKSGHTRALPNLTSENTDPKRIKKMKVKAAAQVLSARTASMLRYTHEVHKRFNDCSATMETTAEAVEFFDELFDSINGSPGGGAKGKLRCAVKIDSPHQEFWRSAIKKLKSIKFIDKNSKLAHISGPRYIRVPSLDGWITTLESFLGLVKLLFTKYGVEYFYPRYINQDPLENFFGRIRSINCRNVNPDVNAFIYSYKSLVMSNILNPHSKNANCEEDDGDTLLDVNHLFSTSNDDNKENISINTSCVPSSSIAHPEKAQQTNITNVIDERVRVQISAYTAGYMCRKITKKINCKLCEKTYISKEIEGIHKFIQFREYKRLKNSNLSYPKEIFLILYRKSSELIHKYLRTKAHEKNIKRTLRIMIMREHNMTWLGCKLHNNLIKQYFTDLIIRLQVHHWCNIINRIMNGKTEEKYVEKADPMQIMAIQKYKKYRLRKNKLNK